MTAAASHANRKNDRGFQDRHLASRHNTLPRHRTVASITGAGVQDGVLHVIGTNQDDVATISRNEQGYQVDANFLAGVNFKILRGTTSWPAVRDASC